MRKTGRITSIPEGLAARALRRRLGGISWPEQYGGRGAALMEQAIFRKSCPRNAPQLIGTIGLSLVGPTIIAMGTEEQKNVTFAPILSARRFGAGLFGAERGQRSSSLGTKAIATARFHRQRAKDLDELCAVGGLVFAARAHGYRGAKAQGHYLPPAGHAAVTVFQCAPCGRCPGTQVLNEMFFSNVRVPISQVLGRSTRVGPRPSRR